MNLKVGDKVFFNGNIADWYRIQNPNRIELHPWSDVEIGFYTVGWTGRSRVGLRGLPHDFYPDQLSKYSPKLKRKELR